MKHPILIAAVAVLAGYMLTPPLSMAVLSISSKRGIRFLQIWNMLLITATIVGGVFVFMKQDELVFQILGNTPMSIDSSESM